MNVKKIFVTLITIVACVILGAFVLNVLMPNAVTTLVNTTENMLFKATGLHLDFNGDGTSGTNTIEEKGKKNDKATTDSTAKTGIEGWGEAGAGGTGG